MSLNVDLKMFGMKGIVNRLEKMKAKARNDRVMFTKMAIVGFKDVQEHFRVESSPAGRWPELSPVTIAARIEGPKRYKGESKRASAKRKRRSPKMLQDQGTLKNSLLPGAGRNQYGGVRYLKNAAVLFTKLPYAAIHNFGGMAGRNRKVRIPKREFMWLSGEAKDRIGKVVKDHVIGHGPGF